MSDEKDITASNFCLEVDKLTTQYNFLQKFIPYNELSKEYFINNKGCYAFYLNNIECVNDFIEKAKARTLLSFERYKNTSYERLFYIGKTNCSFIQRVCNGHLRAKSTAPNRTLANILYGIDKNLYNEYKEQLKNWIQKNITVKFLSIDKVSDINLIETSLIHLYQPPLNKDGYDEYTEE